VSLGPFTSRDDAEQHRRSAIGHGFSPSRVYAAATPEEVPATPRRIATPGPEATDNGQAAQRRISRQSHVLINQFAYEAPVLADEV
jgi:hypothetical protein